MVWIHHLWTRYHGGRVLGSRLLLCRVGFILQVGVSSSCRREMMLVVPAVGIPMGGPVFRSRGMRPMKTVVVVVVVVVVVLEGW
jgi:hypothetical protein